MIRLSRSAAKGPGDFIVIGRVGAPHGIKGLVRIVPLTDFPERFDGLKSVHIKGEPREIVGVEHHGEKLLMRFKGFDTREVVAQLTGELLQVPREEAAPLSDEEYYTFDIIGLAVRDTDGGEHGEEEGLQCEEQRIDG